MVQIRRRVAAGEGQGGGNGEGGSGPFRRYHLRVPRMHGEARKVEVAVRRKRVVVKLYKKKKGRVWPELVRREGVVGGRAWITWTRIIPRFAMTGRVVVKTGFRAGFFNAVFVGDFAAEIEFKK